MQTANRKIALALAAAATAALAVGVASSHAQGQADKTAPLGVWRNPKNSVHVEIRSCGGGICGHIVWANAKAQADARKGSGKDLIGMELFHELKPSNGGVWKGRVFVPDLNRTFGGSAEPVQSTSLRVTGCLFAGVLCKSQTWTRIEAGQV